MRGSRHLCPTEHVVTLIRLGTRRATLAFLLIFLIVLILALANILETRYAISYLAGFLSLASMTIAFEKYGDIIARAATVIDELRCGSRERILTAVYTPMRWLTAIIFMIIGGVLEAYLAKGLPQPHYTLYVIGVALVGFTVGDAFLGIIMFSLSIRKLLVENSNCIVIKKIKKLSIITKVSLSMLISGSILTLIILLVIPYAINQDLLQLNINLLRVIAASTVTPSLAVLVLYPIYMLWRKAMAEKNLIIRNLEEEITLLVERIEELLDKEEYIKIDNEFSKLNALSVIKEFYKNISIFPITGSDVAKTVVGVLLPWLSTINEVHNAISILYNVLSVPLR